ncbi:hypothetical protein D3C85_1537770 [compost metagenome]
MRHVVTYRPQRQALAFVAGEGGVGDQSVFHGLAQYLLEPLIPVRCTAAGFNQNVEGMVVWKWGAAQGRWGGHGSVKVRPHHFERRQCAFQRLVQPT